MARYPDSLAAITAFFRKDRREQICHHCLIEYDRQASTSILCGFGPNELAGSDLVQTPSKEPYPRKRIVLNHLQDQCQELLLPSVELDMSCLVYE